MKNSIPVCYYPMRKIIIDDDSIFSDSLLLALNQKNVTTHNSPKAALRYLLQDYQSTFSKTDLVSINAENLITIDTEKLKTMLMNPPHQDINVLLIDYHMPEMLGVDLLKEIRHLPMKKVLITGEHDYKIGVDAFNSHLVDAYLRKDDPDLADKLKILIPDLEWKYFTELNNVINDLPKFQYLKNIYLIDAFKTFIQKNNVTAFCLTHADGNFLTYNAKQETSHFLLRSRTQLLDLANIAEEDGASTHVIEQLKQGTVIPFFDVLDYWQVPASEWEAHLVPAENVADTDFVWAVK